MTDNLALSITILLLAGIGIMLIIALADQDPREVNCKAHNGTYHYQRYSVYDICIINGTEWHVYGDGSLVR